MNELLNWIADWRHAMPMAVVVVLAPSFLIRIVIRAWPKGDPRRRELLAELAALPVPNRLLWVLGVFELAWQEGLPQRREQSVLWPDVARLPGAVKLGVVAVDVVGVAVVNVPMARVGFAVSALGLLPLTVKHVRATYAFADTTALMGDSMAKLTSDMEADGLLVPDGWKVAASRLASDARRPRWSRALCRIPLDGPLPDLEELGQAVIDDASRQLMERLRRDIVEQFRCALQQIRRDFDREITVIKAQLLEDLERAGVTDVP